MKSQLLDRLANRFTVGDGCWEWIAGKSQGGYGQIRIDGHQRGAHCVLYELLVGPIPEGKELDHLCRNRGCVRPSHLEPVTHAVNIARAPLAPGNRTHCPQGHPYVGSTTYRSPEGYRSCRICRTEAVRRVRAAK